jgi:hypothetical protein
MPDTFVTLQAPEPLAGSGIAMTLPCWSTATQYDFEGQEIPVNRPAPRTRLILQAPAPPVGRVEVTRLPPESTATQNDLEGQETSFMRCTREYGGWSASRPGEDHESGDAALAVPGNDPVRSNPQATTRADAASFARRFTSAWSRVAEPVAITLGVRSRRLWPASPTESTT